MAGFRDVLVASPEGALPGTSRPAAFRNTGLRPGGPTAYTWWVVFLDATGLPLAGGTATLQWYAIDLDGDLVTTPAIGSPVSIAALTTSPIDLGDRVWPWCQVTAMSPPVGGVTCRVYAREAAAGVGSLTVISDKIDALGGGLDGISGNVDLLLSAVGDLATAPQVQAVMDALDGLGSALAGVPTSTVAQLITILRPDLQYYGASLAAASTEAVIGAVGAGSHLEIWGWIGSASDKVIAVALRSGNVANNGTSVGLKDIANNLYPGGISATPHNIVPGTRALWRTANDQGLIAYKSNTDYTYEVYVWFRTVQN